MLEVVYMITFDCFGTLLTLDSVSCLHVFDTPIDDVGHLLLYLYGLRFISVHRSKHFFTIISKTMPNFKGGKHYKKKAKTDGDSAAALMIERQADQQVARVTKVLGNRNMQCYCNDNKVRICRVRGKLRNRVYIEQGDVVLISLRTLADGSDSEEATAAAEAKPDRDNASKPDRGDILAKYPLETHSKLKKEDGVNPKIFMQIEAMEGGKVATLGTAEVAEDFEFDRDGADAEKAESEELDDSDIAAI